MRTTTLFLLTLLFCCTQLSAQTHDRYTALAINGLNLRAKPDKSATVLASIPFKAEVEFLSCDSILVELPDIYRNIENDEIVGKSLSGYWVKVRYQQQTGYAFSAFLGYENQFNGLFYNDSAPMLIGATVNGQWEYYATGLFDKQVEIYGAYEDKGFLTFEKVNIMVYLADYGLTTAVDFKKKYLFVFSLDKKIVPSAAPQKVRNEEFELPLQDAGKKALLSQAGLTCFEENMICASPAKDIAFQLNRDCPTAENETNLFVLKWYGDLDGDGKNDYFYFLQNTAGNLVYPYLWLSSEVARLSSLYCDYYSPEQPFLLTPGVYYSIAKSGLILRETDKANGPVIQKIPYGERVRVLDVPQSGFDTLGIGGIRMMENYETEALIDSIADTTFIVGVRTRVSYQGKTGFVHSSYLCSYPQSVPTGNFCYMRAGDVNYYYNPNWNYYGLYLENGRYQLRKTEPVLFSSIYWSEIGEGYASDLNILGNEKFKDPDFIIGSKIVLKEGAKGTALTDEDYSVWGGDFANADLSALKKMRLEIQPDSTGLGIQRILAIRKNGLKQEIKFRRNYYYPEAYFNGSLEWYGDLDGDGEWDYIFDFYNECGSDNMLYMSSESGTGKVLKESYQQVSPCGC